MTENRNGLSLLDRAVAAEVRSLIARDPELSVKAIADRLRMRRATLSARINGHVAFTPSLLSSVAQLCGTTASDIVARSEREVATQVMAVAS